MKSSKKTSSERPNILADVEKIIKVSTFRTYVYHIERKGLVYSSMLQVPNELAVALYQNCNDCYVGFRPREFFVQDSLESNNR